MRSEMRREGPFSACDVDRAADTKADLVIEGHAGRVPKLGLRPRRPEAPSTYDAEPRKVIRRTDQDCSITDAGKERRLPIDHRLSHVL
jgi:hypothetical protein